uniref:Uncharacterized protein n=1 Tax=Coccolithus braarudii TaxID=221442 RepID=A0A7S0Q4T1_9EUKA|mmetsp:Transcript_42022/g.89730  ORF Transcript_42022/g.89730 Transcript_42022/m.89730 type:complete len:151 (+) Transcript_42022:35-487(+)
MHGLPPVSLGAGFGTVLPGGPEFSEWLLESPYGRWIYKNHMGHHVLSGQCNYNVCCPGTDHLLGTYVSTEFWQDKMRPMPLNAETRGPVVGPQSHGGVPQLPTREAYQAARALRRQMNEGPGGGGDGSILANGGTLIADAYSEEPEPVSV